MFAIEDDAILKGFEHDEMEQPSLRKVDGERTVYATHEFEIPENPTHAVLCDFGDARFGDNTYLGDVMPDLFRAPEIILGIPWNEKVDIWSVGLMVRVIMTGSASPQSFFDD